MSTHSREPGSDPEKNEWLKQFSGLPGDNRPSGPPPERAATPAPELSEEPEVAVEYEDEPAPSMTSSHRMLYFQLMVLPLLIVASIVIYEVMK
jgi:hypothetical protein